jgi:hypothetical protein
VRDSRNSVGASALSFDALSCDGDAYLLLFEYMHTAVTLQLQMNAEPSLCEVMDKLVATIALMVQMQGTLEELKKDVNALKNATFSSSSSGRRVLCPLGCGNDFKKVCRIWRCSVSQPSSLAHRRPTCWITCTELLRLAREAPFKHHAKNACLIGGNLLISLCGPVYLLYPPLSMIKMCIHLVALFFHHSRCCRNANGAQQWHVELVLQQKMHRHN